MKKEKLKEAKEIAAPKMIAHRQNFSDAVRLAASLCREKGIPILRNLLLSGKDGALLISATNLEDTVHIAVPADGDEIAPILVDATRLRDFLAADRAESVSIQCGKGIIIVRGRVEVRLKTEGVEEFPTLPQFPEGNGHATFDRSTFFSTLTDAIRFVTKESRESKQPGSVQLKEFGGLISATATDRGYAAFRRQAICEAPEGFEVCVLIATWNILQSAKGDKLEIASDEKSAQDCFRSGGFVVISRRDERVHPNYAAFFAKMDDSASLELTDDQAARLLEVVRTMAALDGILRIEHDGLGSLVVTRKCDTSEAEWQLQGVGDNAEPFTYATVYPDLWLPALEIVSRGTETVTLKHEKFGVRLDGGEETSIVLASYEG